MHLVSRLAETRRDICGTGKRSSKRGHNDSNWQNVSSLFNRADRGGQGTTEAKVGDGSRSGVGSLEVPSCSFLSSSANNGYEVINLNQAASHGTF